MKKSGKILLWIFLGFIAIQLIPIDRENPPVDSKIDFVKVMKTPENVQEILKNSCYDCHSFETKYPNYSYIAPISWSIKGHINKGRKHLNFSKWGSYNEDLKRNAMKKGIAEIDAGKMPLPSYVVYHENSRLDAKQREILTNYFTEILKELEKN